MHESQLGSWSKTTPHQKMDFIGSFRPGNIHDSISPHYKHPSRPQHHTQGTLRPSRCCNLCQGGELRLEGSEAEGKGMKWANSPIISSIQRNKRNRWTRNWNTGDRWAQEVNGIFSIIPKEFNLIPWINIFQTDDSLADSEINLVDSDRHFSNVIYNRNTGKYWFM